MVVSQIINGYELQELFKAHEQRDTFTGAGYDALYGYLEELADDEGYYVVDVIAICSDLTEYDSIERFNEEYKPAEPISSWDDCDEVVCRVGEKGAIVHA